MIVTRRHVLGALLAGAGAGVLLPRWRESNVHVAHFDGVMGTSLEIRIRGRSRQTGPRAEAAILDEIARQSAILSAYDPSSEFSRWTRTVGTPTRVSPELLDVLVAFDTWRVRTGGVIEASSEAAAGVWRQATLDGVVPDRATLQDVVHAMAARHWTVDASSSTATRTSRAPLVLHSFTKSFVIDRAAARALALDDVDAVTINAGGDLVVRGNWTETIAIADPFAAADNADPIAHVRVRDRAVATSGGSKRGFEVQGRHHSHVIDPRTGWPADGVAGATVVSPSAVAAGALATALCVLTPDESLALVEHVRGAEFMLARADGAYVESAGWRTLGTAPRPSLFASASLAADAAQGGWPAGMQLSITLDLGRAGGGFGRRPYVAVWIEDAEKFPVRTLAVWFDKTRYLPELRAWNRADRLRSMAEGTQILNTVSSATRSAGKYTLQWDGKDNAGKPVNAGTYTVCVEVTREHGTYQLIRQAMDLSAAPVQITVPGGTEINGVSLDYHSNSR